MSEKRERTEEEWLRVKPEFKKEVAKRQKEDDKKHRGQNKGRHFQALKDNIDLCIKAAVGQECTKENCKASHDVEAYINTREPDLDGNCPIFDVFGFCRFGIKCRYAGKHTVDGKQIQKPEAERLPETGHLKNLVNVNDIKNMRTGATKSEMSDAFMKVYETHKDGMIDSDLIKLRPEEKKKLDLRGKTYLAPLTTVGNIPFRRVCKGFGVDVTCGEMMLTNSLLSGSQSEWSLMRRHESEDIFGIQMTGADVPGFAQCCDFIQQQMDIDFLDINLGCPIDTVCKKGAGSTLLGRPTRLNHLCTAAVQILDCPVTVKIRTGIDEKNIAHKLLPIFQNSGVSAVTLHGRSKKQRYTKLANWEYMNECASILDRQKTQFIGNGDIFNPQEYHDRLKNTNVDAIMIGRGALIKPWIFTEIKENKLWDISSSERFDMLRKFCNFGLEYWGSDTKGVNQTRRYLCEWQSFLHRYVPVGIIETLPQQINIRPEPFVGRDDLETLMASPNAQDWVKLSEMLLGPAPESFHFVPKHKSNAYETNG